MNGTRLALIGVVLLGIGVARACTSSESAENSEVASIDTTRYVPEVDEGLGASIAIVLDNSGSMEDDAEGDDRPKFIVAKEALATLLATTDSFVTAQPDFNINVGFYAFSTNVKELVPVRKYDPAALRSAIESLEAPDGGTAIGDAMDAAREGLYRAGTFRKYILVVTDGENTDGRSPRAVAHEIARRSEGAIRIYFVAFDIDEEKFDFLREVRGEVLGAANGLALKASLDTIYRGKILAEALDAGETLPDTIRPDTARTPKEPPR